MSEVLAPGVASHPIPFSRSRVRPDETLQYRLNVMAADVAGVVSGIGGWLFDRAMAGWRVSVAGSRCAGRCGAGVVFKAEVGSQSPAVGQIQGVWVHPEWRGHGLGTAGTAALAAAVVASGRIASLYVNSYNTVARATYARIGFEQVGTFATVLLD